MTQQTMISENETLEKVYTAQNHEELMDAYSLWAQNYEKDTVDACGYVAPKATALALHEALGNNKARILDAGCGTGLVGLALRQLGYTSIDALDYSQAMLAEARKKEVYQNLMQVDLSKPLSLPADGYDGITCTGTFTYGHVGPDAFEELIRITKRAGIICFTVREGAYEDHAYREKMCALEKAQLWELQSLYDTDYLQKEAVTCKMCVFKVTK